jgi:broad specificity phosphatase PhoE
LIWRGLAACNPAINDVDDARQCLEQATALMKSAHDEDVWNELQVLKQKLTSRGSIDQKLRAWSRGVTEGKSFQTLADEFAELVIPRVWEREGKKVARVAKVLKISPKKVRKILDQAGKTRR